MSLHSSVSVWVICCKFAEQKLLINDYIVQADERGFITSKATPFFIARGLGTLN